MSEREDLDLGTERLLAHIEGGAGWMTYNNPARHNALSLEMQQAVPRAMERFASDDRVRVVVVRGAGDQAFISGADISEFETQRSSSRSRKGFDETFSEATRSYLRLEKPIVAMIQGYCLGGGLATALLADIRIASSDARFGIPAARLGLGYGYEGIQTLVSLVGPAFAQEILLSARRFSAEEAHGMGLVNRVVPKSELAEAVQELAGRMAENAPLTMRAAKFAIRQTQRNPEQRDLDACRRLVEECFRSDDYVEGRRAFMEKRTPAFKGR